MDKLLIVKITSTVRGKKEISVILGQITCSTSDEAHIKHYIEITRNPNRLVSFLRHLMGNASLSEITADIQKIREIISNADSIDAGIFGERPCDNVCETCLIKDIHDDIHKKIAKMQKHSLHLCPN